MPYIFYCILRTRLSIEVNIGTFDKYGIRNTEYEIQNTKYEIRQGYTGYTEHETSDIYEMPNTIQFALRSAMFPCCSRGGGG